MQSAGDNSRNGRTRDVFTMPECIRSENEPLFKCLSRKGCFGPSKPARCDAALLTILSYRALFRVDRVNPLLA